MKIEDYLNLEQQEVVKHTEGPVLVLAGAGSGKTRCVIFRTAYLINVKKIDQKNILVVTFTNKAANELKERIFHTFGIKTQSLWIGTFHSICSRILRRESDFIPHNSNFTIYDQVDQQSLLKKIYKKLDIDKKKFPIGKIAYIISKHKNSLILPKDFYNFNEENIYTQVAEKIYREYQQNLLENNALDFDDLLLYTAILLHDNVDIRRKYQKLFRYVMIDEYQDTNYAQFKIVNLIAQKHQNLCVVGDDDQAIYSWRGADIKNILNFERDYKNVKTIKLERNYRSPATILDAAHSLIEKNQSRHEKKLWTEKKSEAKPKLIKLFNEREEAKFVVNEILKLKKLKNLTYNQFVVLYRTNAQSRVFESAFTRKQIRYQIIGGVNFYQRKEIKDILAFLKILHNPNDAESLLRIINFPPRGIGKVTINKIQNFAADNEMNIFEAVMNDDLLKYLGAAAKRLTTFKTLINRLRTSLDDIPKLVEQLIKLIKMKELYDTDDPQDISRLENIKEFVAAAKEFCEHFAKDTGNQPDLSEFLQNISLQTDLDNYDSQESSVKLMTMHNAKGLEFSYVFVVGVEDGLIPHSRSIDSDRQLEEERRLLYVAITRAKEKVFLSYAEMRRTYNTVISCLPSRFLMDIDDKLLAQDDSNNYYDIRTPKRKKRKRYHQNVTTENEKHFRIGQKINHTKFGNGVILNIDGKGENAKLTISFSHGSLKKIVGSFVEVI